MDDNIIFEDGYLIAKEDRILALGAMDSYSSGLTAGEDAVVIDAKGAWLLPAFIDHAPAPCH